MARPAVRLRLVSAVAAMVTLVACRSGRERPSPSAPSSADASAARPVSGGAAAPESTSVRVFSGADAVCFVSSSSAGTATCGAPRRMRRDAGEAWELAPSRATGATTEPAPSSPYAVAPDGHVVVTDGWDGATEAEDQLRHRLAAALPPLTKLAHTAHGSCGIDRAGKVHCWVEPALPFRPGVMVPTAPVVTELRGAAEAEDVAMMPWLTVCVRTKQGAVRCTPAPSRDVELCVLRGSSDARCGPSAMVAGRPELATAGEPPAEGFAKELALVPELEGRDPAVALALYDRPLSSMLESERRLLVGDHDEGGCALLESGTVRCFERDRCAPSRRWTSTQVRGLPSGAKMRLVLGAHDGYAMADGALFSWPRRDGRVSAETCPKPSSLTAERVPLARVVEVWTRTLRAEGLPLVVGVDCAVLHSGWPTCWVTRERAKLPLPIASP